MPIKPGDLFGLKRMFPRDNDLTRPYIDGWMRAGTKWFVLRLPATSASDNASSSNALAPVSFKPTHFV
ncbi:MAG: hypothetical protein BGO03_11615 [Mesorhizobium sp. 61-13]|nr:MAG: hypothetical protein BGO03_11615 [Mesorhizobium sp. 61-13]